MQKDMIQEYVRLARELHAEKQQIKARLAVIDSALSQVPAASAATVMVSRPALVKAAPVKVPKKAAAPAKSVGIIANKMTMREAVASAIRKQPLGIRDIVDAMSKG